MDPISPTQLPSWSQQPLELLSFEFGYAVTTNGVTTTTFDIINW